MTASRYTRTIPGITPTSAATGLRPTAAVYLQFHLGHRTAYIRGAASDADLMNYVANPSIPLKTKVLLYFSKKVYFYFDNQQDITSL